MKSLTPPHTEDIQYYITPDHPCSYLKDQMSRMVFVDPCQAVDTNTFSQLARVGFRRSGDFIYRPECHTCQQCLSVRIPVNQFKISSVQKKALKQNRNLQLQIKQQTDINTDTHYDLYQRYIHARHADGDMYPPSPEQFEKFLIHTCTDSFFIEFWLEQQLVAVAACDILDDGISAVYTFYNPELKQHSLGTFAILSQIEYAKTLGLPYVYLGYWVPHSTKMKYKAQFLPLEILINGQWHQLQRRLSEQEMLVLGHHLIHPPAETDH